jgi:Fic family protein
MTYSPPFTLNNKIVSLVANISEQLGRLSATQSAEQSLLLRKVNRVRTIQGSLAIEGNQLSEEQITAILDGKRVIAPAREVQEASNALTVYEQLDSFQFDDEKALLLAHKQLMLGLIDSAGQYRSTGVGVFKNDQVIHMAPPEGLVPRLMNDLFAWLATSDDHPLIKSCVFHYLSLFTRSPMAMEEWGVYGKPLF